MGIIIDRFMLPICLLHVCCNTAFGRTAVVPTQALATYPTRHPLCPNIFHLHTGAIVYSNYCTQMAFRMSRVVPEQYRADICYSKCLQSSACLYFNYNSYSTYCIVCVQYDGSFPDPKVGMELERQQVVPPIVYARIGLENGDQDNDSW